MRDITIIRDTVINNVDIIIDNRLTWNEAIDMFNINDTNLQKIYIRYIIKKYGYMTALLLVK
jgi:hypothetical protein